MLNLFAVTVIVAAAVSAAPNRHNDVNAVLRESLEEFRLQMPSAINVEEPQTHLVINDDNDLLKKTFTNVIVTGLDGFVIDVLDFNLARMHLDYSITFPQLNIKGNYVLNLTQNGIIYDGDGPFSVTICNVNVRGFMDFNVEQGYLKLVDFEGVLSMLRIHANFEGMFEDNKMNDAFNKGFEKGSTLAVTENQSQLSAELKSAVTSFVNENMNELTLADLMGQNESRQPLTNLRI